MSAEDGAGWSSSDAVTAHVEEVAENLGQIYVEVIVPAEEINNQVDVSH